MNEVLPQIADPGQVDLTAGIARATALDLNTVPAYKPPAQFRPANLMQLLELLMQFVIAGA